MQMTKYKYFLILVFLLPNENKGVLKNEFIYVYSTKSIFASLTTKIKNDPHASFEVMVSQTKKNLKINHDH